MTTHTLLIEVGTEEIPAQYLTIIEQQFAASMLALLNQFGFDVKANQIKRFSTPRRLALSIQDITKETPSQTKIKTGPLVSKAYKDGKPTPAAIGFAKSAGKKVEDLHTQQTPKGDVIAD